MTAIGVEEEYLLVDPVTGLTVPQVTASAFFVADGVGTDEQWRSHSVLPAAAGAHASAFTAAAKRRGRRAAVGMMREASTGCWRALTSRSVRRRWWRVAWLQSVS